MMSHRVSGPAGPTTAESGSALVLALIAAFLLLIVSFEVAHTSRIEGFITYNIEDETRLEVSCRAGLEKALAVLREDRQQTEIDSQQEAWWSLIADDQLVEADVGNEEFLFEDEPNYGYGDSEEDEGTLLNIRIYDESAKFNVYQLLAEDPTELRKRKERLANVIDKFREETDHDLTFPDGREIADQIHAFLQRTQESPYGDTTKPATKAPTTLIDISDLLYVRGITPEIMWDLTDDDREEVVPGLFRFLTIWSDQQININTGELPALAGLFESKDVFLADRIVAHRQEILDEKERTKNYVSEGDGTFGGVGENDETDSTGGAPFTQINELKEKVEGMSDAVYNDINRFITVRSPVFSVYVTAKHGFARKTKMWVVRRSEIGFQILYERLVDFPYFTPPDEAEEAEEAARDLNR
ncbi:MAG: type II secretion system protein GspK [Planctomycetota bacterium]